MMRSKYGNVFSSGNLRQHTPLALACYALATAHKNHRVVKMFFEEDGS
jgi:hypothetical protein